MILVTGAAGFIGFHVARQLLERGEPVVGVDSLGVDGESVLTLARQIHRHPTRGELVHVDFIRIRRDKSPEEIDSLAEVERIHGSLETAGDRPTAEEDATPEPG